MRTKLSPFLIQQYIYLSNPVKVKFIHTTLKRIDTEFEQGWICWKLCRVKNLKIRNAFCVFYSKSTLNSITIVKIFLLLRKHLGSDVVEHTNIRMTLLSIWDRFKSGVSDIIVKFLSSWATIN